MKQTLILACFALATLAHANPSASDQQLLAAIKEVQTQQAAIAANQAKINEKIVAVVEAVRVARIYSSRSGN